MLKPAIAVSLSLGQNDNDRVILQKDPITTAFMTVVFLYIYCKRFISSSETTTPPITISPKITPMAIR